ncbi:c-type cytochrome [Sinorhizobium medicae]
MAYGSPPLQQTSAGAAGGPVSNCGSAHAISRAAQQADGGPLFRQRCATCHAVDPGENKAGPCLASIAGRPAASVDGAHYSKALKSAGITWDRQSLDAFLATEPFSLRHTNDGPHPR